MHSGFGALRSNCPMNIEASLPDSRRPGLRDKPAVRADVARLVAMWSELLAQHGGPMLFGDFTIADAYFAPVCMRIKTYALPVPAPIAAYIERVCALPGVKAWIDDALAEKDFLDFEEPYRLRATDSRLRAPCRYTAAMKTYRVGGAVRDELAGPAGPGPRLGGGGRHAASR